MSTMFTNFDGYLRLVCVNARSIKGCNIYSYLLSAGCYLSLSWNKPECLLTFGSRVFQGHYYFYCSA